LWYTALELEMMEPARRRWRGLSIDDRVVLAFAFRDAIKNPLRVGDYKLQLYRRNSTGEFIQIHHFRFGFANFILVDIPPKLFIYDFWLDDDIALAAE
jgi:hypothetical protein